MKQTKTYYRSHKHEGEKIITYYSGKFHQVTGVTVEINDSFPSKAIKSNRIIRIANSIEQFYNEMPALCAEYDRIERNKKRYAKKYAKRK